MKLIVAKVFEERDGKPRFFKHPHDGSIVVPTDKWIEAVRKDVRDGSGDSYYTSAFHIMTDESKLAEWCNSLHRTKGRFCSLVLAEGIKKKEKSRYGLFLANRIMLPLSFWKMRIPLVNLLEG